MAVKKKINEVRGGRFLCPMLLWMLCLTKRWRKCKLVWHATTTGHTIFKISGVVLPITPCLLELMQGNRYTLSNVLPTK